VKNLEQATTNRGAEKTQKDLKKAQGQAERLSGGRVSSAARSLGVPVAEKVAGGKTRISINNKKGKREGSVKKETVLETLQRTEKKAKTATVTKIEVHLEGSTEKESKGDSWLADRVHGEHASKAIKARGSKSIVVLRNPEELGPARPGQ